MYLYYSKALADILAPQITASRANKVTVSIEPCSLSTARLGFVGTRDFYAVPALALAKHLSQGSSEQTSMKTMATWLKDVDAEAVQKFLPNKLFHGTVGPQDALILPVGWMFAERADNQKDVLTIRVPILKRDHVENLDEWKTFWQRADKPNEILQAIMHIYIYI